MIGRCAASVWLLVLGGAAASGQEAGPVGPADYPVIVRLLREPPPGPVSDTRFEDLWHDPAGAVGRAVRVTGMARRAFRQPATGAFPALVELWITDNAGNPVGLLFPDQADARLVGHPVAFRGRVLRLVDYPDGHGVRRAPLIVGSAPPTMTTEGRVEPGAFGSSYGEWVTAVVLLGLVVIVLGLQHARRPRRPGRPTGPRPQFESPAAEDPEAGHG